MARKPFKCSKCDRSFSMAAHLARHRNTMHAPGRRAASAKKAKARATQQMANRLGVRRGSSNLQGMSLDDLMNLIDAARAEARQRLAEVESLIG
jgi:hypothetical protein